MFREQAFRAVYLSTFIAFWILLLFHVKDSLLALLVRA
jgi:hypothetical protein